jgi:serine/threonine protein kinase
LGRTIEIKPYITVPQPTVNLQSF